MKVLGRKSVSLILVTELGEVLLPVLPCGVRAIATSYLTAVHHSTVAIAALIVVSVADKPTISRPAGGALTRLSVGLSTALRTLLALLSFLSLAFEGGAFSLIPLPLVAVLLTPKRLPLPGLAKFSAAAGRGPPK